MIISKITTGFVVQIFDTDIGQFVSQMFVAGDECSYENACPTDGKPVDSNLLEVDGKEAYLPFEMVQPINYLIEA